MGVIPISMSLIASFMSGITILGNPSEVYMHGTMFWLSGVSHIIVTIVVGYVFIPFYHKLEITSTYTVN
jgi:solute carrier family 5 (sodium-coupled monocarboxylate transporter), member 8/12